MRASGSGPFGAMLMIAPLVAVPILAVVGIPQFAPVVASPADENPYEADLTKYRAPVEEGHGESLRYAADDLFAPFSEDSASASSGAARTSPRSRASAARNEFAGEAFENEFAAVESFDAQVPSRPASRRNPRGREWDPPSDALSGWQMNAGEEQVAMASHRGGGQRGTGQRGYAQSGEQFDSFGSQVSEQPFGTPAAQTAGFPEETQFASEASPRVRRRAETRDAGFARDERVSAADVNPFLESSFEAAPAATSARTTRAGARSARGAAPVEDFPAADQFGDAQAQSFGNENPQFGQEEPFVDDFGAPAATEPYADVAAPTSSLRTTPAGSAPVRTVAASAAPATYGYGGGAEEFTWQTATQQLKRWGIRKHYFTYVEDRDTFLFSCSLTPTDNPAISQRFEAEHDEPLLAVREVLLQIDQWQAQRTAARSGRGTGGQLRAQTP